MVDSPASSRFASFVLYASVAAAVMLLAAQMFIWNIIDVLTPFLGGPLVGVIWLATVIIGVVAAVHALAHWRRGWQAFLPVAIAAGALSAATFVPFTQLWLKMNFELKREAREKVVRQVRSGELKPNVAHDSSLIRLPDGSGLSLGGDEIVAEGPPDRPLVFFFTYRGILDNYSGFLWVPDGEDPKHFMDADEPGTEIVTFGGNWYFIGHR